MVTIQDLEGFSKTFIHKIREVTHHKHKVYDIILVKTLFSTLKVYTIYLNRTYVSTSKIDGNGLFASRKIKKGEIITFYPPHYILHYKNGNHYPNCPVNQLDSDIVKEKQLKFNESIFRYRFNINSEYSICGDPRITDCPTFLGHMINDGARGHSTRKNYNHKDEEIYNKILFFVNNSYAQYVGNSYMVIIASKDIEKDEEILMPYGYDYWID